MSEESTVNIWHIISPRDTTILLVSLLILVMALGTISHQNAKTQERLTDMQRACMERVAK